MTGKAPSGPRSVALIGPYSSGKTSLMESMLFVAGAISRKGNVKDGNMVGDASDEARGRQMSVEVSTATFDFMDETFSVVDCPGSLEFLQETYSALSGVVAAVLVSDADLGRAVACMPLLKFLDERRIPTLVFVNKMDRPGAPVTEFVAALQATTSRRVVLRQLPISDDENTSGYIDLLHKRAYHFEPGGGSTQVDVPAAMADDLDIARTDLLEIFADFDDALMEKLLEDDVPEMDEVYETLHREFGQGDIIPVLIGAGETESGVRRLLKALRHDVPEAAESAARAGVPETDDAVVQVLKTYHTAASGKLSLVRVWRAAIKDGMSLNKQRIGGINRMLGQTLTKVSSAAAGEVVALGRMDGVATGDFLSSGDAVAAPESLAGPPLKPVYAFKVGAENRNDEVKLSDALTKLVEEDPSLVAEANQESHEMLLWGQGEMHLKVALDRARNKFHLPLVTERPAIPYKETIRKPATGVHGRHKKQSGGHGQFGDVIIDIKPRPRGAGVEFENKIVGGVVPRQYIPAVEHGVIEFCKRGPLGFPVVDVAVTLVDGSHHAVDSSEIAFQTAGRIAMNAGMPTCSPVLLEPILHVDVHVPIEFTPQVQRLLSGRRGQILGFEPRAGWEGWDTVSAQVPQAEVYDLIIELRSLTRGVGTFDYRFDHLQELSGKIADDVVAAVQAAQ